jgi:hypothetical protein
VDPPVDQWGVCNGQAALPRDLPELHHRSWEAVVNRWLIAARHCLSTVHLYTHSAVLPVSQALLGDIHDLMD